MGLGGERKPEKAAPAKAGPGAKPRLVPAQAPKVVLDKLFRFFDFSVVPGKRYRYRIQLGLKNPNFELPDRFLKANANRKDKILVTGWSEPTPIVSIPYGNRFLAGGIDTAGLMTVKLIAIAKEEGIQESAELKVARGNKVNLVKKIDVANPIGGGNKTIEFDFQTNALVLDLRGGKTLHRNAKDKVIEPGEVLVLDRTGNLAVHNELDEAEQWTQNVPSHAPAPTAIKKDVLVAPTAPPRSRKK